jgi:glycosyltransferase involved in cell wall biosynthesis
MARLRVAIDARRFQDVPLGGVGRSIAGMLDLLAAEVDVVLLTDALRGEAPSGLPQVALARPRGTPETVWLQWSASRWLRGFDGVFHGTFNALPFRLAVPSVVTIHDLSFEVHPEGFSHSKRRVFQLHARHAARVAPRVVAPTNYTKRELVREYGIDAGRVVVAPWGVDARFTPANASRAPALCARLGVPGKYVVAMGGAPRRGLDVALGAWRRLRAAGPDLTLVVAGQHGGVPEPGVVHAGKVDDRDWETLLAGAEAFCYPTRYEGFGIPALEAAASGAPVVCAPVASLPEVLEDAAEWCATPTVDAIAAGLSRVIDDPHRAAARRAAGLARAARHPTWEHAAEVHLAAYRDAYGGRVSARTPRRRAAPSRAPSRSAPN